MSSNTSNRQSLLPFARDDSTDNVRKTSKYYFDTVVNDLNMNITFDTLTMDDVNGELMDWLLAQIADQFANGQYKSRRSNLPIAMSTSKIFFLRSKWWIKTINKR